jgi:hypothetical protein
VWQPSAKASKAASGKTELARSQADNLCVEVRFGKDAADASEGLFERKSNMVTEHGQPGPCPPPPPSIVMKYTARSPAAISLANSCQKSVSPTTDLIPTGSPVRSAILYSRRNQANRPIAKGRVPRGIHPVLVS